MSSFADLLLTITSEQVIEGAKIAVVILGSIIVILFAPEIRRGIDRLPYAVFTSPRVVITTKDGKKKVVASGMSLRLTDDDTE